MSIESASIQRRLQVLRLPQVQRVTGLCRSTIYELEARKCFPNRIKIGPRAVGWLEGDIQDWLADRVRSSKVLNAN